MRRPTTAQIARQRATTARMKAATTGRSEDIAIAAEAHAKAYLSGTDRSPCHYTNEELAARVGCRPYADLREEYLAAYDSVLRPLRWSSVIKSHSS